MNNKGFLRLDLRDESSGQPKHERLKSHLVGEIIAGRLAPGDALPSEHRLVETLGVARMTIRQAMVSLENDGLIRRVQGKGNYVEADARRKLQRGLDIFALVVPETRESYYPSLLSGFDAAAAEIHHRTIICETADDVDRQAAILLQLLDQGVGGVAVNPTSPQLTPAYQIRQVQERGIPVVLLHRGVDGIRAPLVAIPFAEVGRLAGKALAGHGHRRVAYISSCSPDSSPEAQALDEGLQRGLQAGGSGVAVTRMYIEERPITLREESCWAALQELFARPDPPTALFTSYDALAEMIYLFLPRLGLRVPDDVSLVGFGSAWREGALTRRLTSVVVDETAAGQQAVAWLHEMRRGDRPIGDSVKLVMELGLSDGETLAAPPPAAVRLRA